MVERVPMTTAGAEQLRAELDRLKSEERPKIIEKIAEARAHGDLKENAEYHAAKESQGFLEGRIREIEGKLSCAQVIDVTQVNAGGRIVFGTTVHAVNQDTDDEVIYQIVGDDEADLKHNKISVNSPIARAFIGKEESDEVIVKTPSGDIYYEITQVEYV